MLPTDIHTSSRRALKLAQEQEVAEDWRRPRNERERSRRLPLRDFGRKEQDAKGDRGRARHVAQTASERQATSQWKSTCERGAETSEEREKRNAEVQRYGTLNEAMKM